MIGMLDVLKQVEKELGSLLERTDWQSLDINYHAPRVERVWLQWHGFRINLHRIHACTPRQALFHPHPWPSVVRVIEGGYWSAIGYGDSTGPDPAMAAEFWLAPNSIVSMEEPYGWHLVAPPAPSLSLMVTSAPWQMKMSFKPGLILTTLSDEKIESLKNAFKDHYPNS